MVVKVNKLIRKWTIYNLLVMGSVIFIFNFMSRKEISVVKAPRPSNPLIFKVTYTICVIISVCVP